MTTLNKAGSITHKAQLQVTFGKETRTVDFFITDLGQDRAVLGFPFLRDFCDELCSPLSRDHEIPHMI